MKTPRSSLIETPSTSSSALGKVHLDVLAACHELTVRAREILPLLASRWGVEESQVFYTLMLKGPKGRGQLPGTAWKYFAHGFECDVWNADDGRFLRIDFGPKGRVDTFTAWGVLQIIMTSTSPWAEFPQLREPLAASGPPYDKNSGSLTKMLVIWDELEAQGVFEIADPGLVAFQAEHTTVGSDGIAYIRFPPGTPDEMSLDCSVAHRQKLSEKAFALLRDRGQVGQ